MALPWLIGAAVVGLASYALSDSSSSSSSSSSSYDPEEAKRKKRKILKDELSDLKSAFRNKWGVSFSSGNRAKKVKNSISKIDNSISELKSIRKMICSK